jgi:hypothetical protein
MLIRIRFRIPNTGIREAQKHPNTVLFFMFSLAGDAAAADPGGQRRRRRGGGGAPLQGHNAQARSVRPADILLITFQQEGM